MTFRVLFVCTGNICRSPMAEHMFRQGLRDRLGEAAREFVVASAGTGALVGQPMQPFAAEALYDMHIDGSAFRAKKIESFQVEGADLVLTASREHRGVAVTAFPRGSRKTFTIREFDRLLSGVVTAGLPVDRAERARALVAAAAGQRGLIRAETPEDDDINDPYLGPRAGYDGCVDLLQLTLKRPLDLLAG